MAAKNPAQPAQTGEKKKVASSQDQAQKSDREQLEREKIQADILAVQAQTKLVEAEIYERQSFWSHSEMFKSVGIGLAAAIGLGISVYTGIFDAKREKLEAQKIALDYEVAKLRDAKNEEQEKLDKLVQGLSDGGDSYLQVAFAAGQPNIMDVSLVQAGKYPLRSVNVKITDESKRFNSQELKIEDRPRGEFKFEQKLGDIGVKSVTTIAGLKLTPGITNYFRFDIDALNGFSWEIVQFKPETNQWITKLIYRMRKIQEKISIEPPNFHGLLVY